MKKTLSFVSAAAACAVTGLALAVERVDSANNNNTWQPLVWSSARSWFGYQYPQGGGIAKFLQSSKISNDRGPSWEYYNQNVSGLELKALQFGNFYSMDFKGQAIKFIGGDPWIDTARTDTDISKLMIMNVELRGDGANALAKKGAGRIVINKPVSDMAYLDLAGGTVVITNGTGTDVLGANGVPVKVRMGGLSFEPQEADGATTVGKLIVGEGIGKVAVKGGTLTAVELAKEPGGVLRFASADGGKFLVAGKTSAEAPDGGMVAFDGNDVKFLDYDETEGWKAGTSIPSNARVFGTSADAKDTTHEIGALAFENEGYVWRPAVAGGAKLKVAGPLSAPGGITFSTHDDNGSSGNRTKIDLSALSGVNVPLRFNGMMVSGVTPVTFAAGTDVSVNGDASYINDSSIISFDCQKIKDVEFKFNLHLGGAGVNNNLSAEGADWQYKLWQQGGKTILENDSRVTSGSGVILQFKGPVSGRGGFKLVNNPCVRLLNAANTFAGDLRVEDSSSVSVREGGTLGTGDVDLASDNARLHFYGLSAPLAVTNHFIGTTGHLAVEKKSTVTLAQAATVKQAFVQDGSTLKLGKGLTTGHVYLDHDSTIVPAGADATLTTDSSNCSVLAGRLADGADGEKLSLVKNGSNTLVVCGADNAYTGATLINGGTVKLGGDLFDASDVSWWVDAADSSTVTLDGNGKITEVRSKVGDFKFTGNPASTGNPPPDYVTNEGGFNGKPFFRFSPSGQTSAQFFTVSPRLTGSDSAEARSVFIVCHSKIGEGAMSTQGALIGYGSQDVSLRIHYSSGTIAAGQTENQDFWPTAGYGRQNGKRIAGSLSTTALEGANVVAVFVTHHLIAGSGYNHYSNFKPYLGDNAQRPWAGDLGEVIAFKRVLTEAECCAVENYLMAKWNPTRTTQHAAAECASSPRANFLPAGTDLQVACGATLDLNGSEQTVASLSGEGMITNSSETAATLIVTGGGDFHGQVVGNVTLVLPTGDRKVVMREGARLLVSGAGDATVAVDNPAPPTHDLAFWIDAADKDSVTLNADGKVTFWNCREADKCVAKGFRYTQGTYGTYQDAGWNAGKPAVFFGGKDTFYKSGLSKDTEKYCDVLTLFYVVKPVPGTGTPYVFGPDGADVGMTANPWDGGFTLNCRGASYLNTVGDLLRLNGVDRTAETAASCNINQQTLCYVMRACDAHKNDPDKHLIDRVWCIGSHSGTRAVAQYVAEVIGYTKQLTDAEVLTTEKYLMDKWFNSGTEWPTPETDAYDATCGLGAAAGATLDLGGDVTLATVGGNGGTVRTSGTLTVTDGFVFPVIDGKVEKVTIEGNLTIGSRAVAQFLNGDGLDRKHPIQRVLEATGAVSGNISATEGLPRKWSMSRSGNVWSIGRNGMMLIVR